MAPAGAIIMSDDAYYAQQGGEMAPVEITGGEPHVVGGHGLSGYWIDNQRRTTLPGLWAAGDVAGGSPKKYASGAWAEAVIAVRDMIESARAHVSEAAPPMSADELLAEQQRVSAPLRAARGPLPEELEARLQKIMDEYAGGIGSQYGYSEGELRIARVQLERLAQELPALRAETPFQLMQCHEVVDRVEVARTLVEHMSHRRETRWHCYQERLDYPERDDARFMLFVNSVRDPDGALRIVERPVERAQIEVQLPPLADGAVIRGRR
jgi:adenylylsulfate reductase subunit A